MYELKMEGAFSSQLGEETVKSFENTTGIPKNTEGRAPDTSATMKSTGKIRSAADGGLADGTVQVAQWANNMDDAKAYQKVTATANAAGQVLRRVTFPHAFVVGYSEEFDVTAGVGSYELTIRQKKDLLENILVEGGFTL